MSRLSKAFVRGIPIGLTLAALALAGGITNLQATPWGGRKPGFARQGSTRSSHALLARSVEKMLSRSRSTSKLDFVLNPHDTAYEFFSEEGW